MEQKIKKIAKFDTEIEPSYQDYLNEFNKIGDDPKNIIILNNFVEDQDLKDIYEYLNKYKDDDNFKGGLEKRYADVLIENENVANLLTKYQNLIFEEVKKYYIDTYGCKIVEKPHNALHFIKWTSGMFSGLHADCERPDGKPAFHADFYKLNISALIYVNDDYEGGKIAFPFHNLEYKPKPGDLIIFPSKYRHEVQNVEGGNNRYTMPTWYTFDVPELFNTTIVKTGDAEDSVILWKNDGDEYTKEEAF
jgi:hypothetical protein